MFKKIIYTCLGFSTAWVVGGFPPPPDVPHQELYSTWSNTNVKKNTHLRCTLSYYYWDIKSLRDFSLSSNGTFLLFVLSFKINVFFVVVRVWLAFPRRTLEDVPQIIMIKTHIYLWYILSPTFVQAFSKNNEKKKKENSWHHYETRELHA